MGLILVGMPGREKRLAWYPQRYAWVGFVHQYRALDRGEQQDLLVQQGSQWKSPKGVERTIEKEALAKTRADDGREISADGVAPHPNEADSGA